MKYLNTSYLGLLGSRGSSITSSNGYIQTATTTSINSNRFSINVPSLQNLYFSVNCPLFNDDIARAVIAVSFANTNNVLCFAFSSSITKIQKITSLSNDTATDLWTGSASADSDGNRIIHVRINTTAKTLDMYINGVLIVETLSYSSISGAGVAQVLTFGKINSSIKSAVRFNNFIISDSSFPPTERVIDVTPTITTTDWTVTDGITTTDTVGDEMTLTVPSGVIDETTLKPTGYTVGLLDSAPSTNVNAVDITQGSTTDQVVIPSGSTQSAYFTVNQVSAISATVVARSVTV